jgi:signal transduction histidine kinase/ActR/RegA family two-component response regulator
MVLDATGVILHVNLIGCRTLVAMRRFVVGTPLRIWVGTESRDALSEHIMRCRQDPASIETELELKAGDGRRIPVRLVSRRSEFRKRVLFPTIAVDLSEQTELERARQAAERQRDRAERERSLARASEAAKDRLIAMVSHELRNPLSPAIIAASHLTAVNGLPDRVRELAAIIKRNIELEARLIDDLLDVARVTRGQLDLRFQVVDIHEVLRQAVDACTATARDKGLRITVRLDAEGHHARADAGRLQQVFWNLLNNAIKFSHEQATVSVRTSSDESGVLLVAVRDQGVGMDAETLEHLFSPFERPVAPAGQRAGLGLGLTIARGVVEAHGGRIWAASQGEGMGSVFEVELLTCPAEASLEAPAYTPAPRSSTPLRRDPRRVLIVEDDVDTATMLSLFLEGHGYDVSVAHTVDEARTKLGAEWYAIVSDIGLGDGSGLELARSVQALEDQPRILVALSGYGTDEDIEASQEAGFDTHLVKPVDLDQLVALLEDEQPAFGIRGGTDGRRRGASADDHGISRTSRG